MAVVINSLVDRQCHLDQRPMCFEAECLEKIASNGSLWIDQRGVDIAFQRRCGVAAAFSKEAWFGFFCGGFNLNINILWIQKHSRDHL